MDERSRAALAAFGLTLVKDPGPEKTEQVALNLEESGTLCHLLLREMTRPVRGPPSTFDDTPEIRAAVLRRQAILYGKLCAANDRIMGKD